MSTSVRGLFFSRKSAWGLSPRIPTPAEWFPGKSLGSRIVCIHLNADEYYPGIVLGDGLGPFDPMPHPRMVCIPGNADQGYFHLKRPLPRLGAIAGYPYADAIFWGGARDPRLPGLRMCPLPGEVPVPGNRGLREVPFPGKGNLRKAPKPGSRNLREAPYRVIRALRMGCFPGKAGHKDRIT